MKVVKFMDDAFLFVIDDFNHVIFGACCEISSLTIKGERVNPAFI